MNRATSSRGFTLAEMAIVLVIVGLLLGGLLGPLSSQTELRQRSDNEKTLADVREALIGFAIINGRLPCPANPAVPSGTGGSTCPGAAGCEAFTGSGTALACTSASGVLPWATLGLIETDAWNNRFTYRVTLNFARGIPQTSLPPGAGFGCSTAPPTDPVNAAFALCTPGGISVLTASTGGTTLASGIPAIIVSHGKNGLGAWTTIGSQTSASTATADEQENANGNVTFVSNVNNDDQLIWLSPNLLMNRMIAAGKLP